MDPSQTQKSLIQRAKLGDPLAWQNLTDLYRPFITGWARRHTEVEQDAEDLAQEILLEVVAYLPRFEHNGQFGAFRCWLRTLAVHTTGHFWAARARQPQGTGDSAIQASLNLLSNGDSSLSRAWDDEHDQYILNRLLEQVGQEFEVRTMKAFCRLTLDGACAEVVAQEMNMSIGAVYTTKSRVFLRLRQLSEGILDWSEEGDRLAT